MAGNRGCVRRRRTQSGGWLFSRHQCRCWRIERGMKARASGADGGNNSGGIGRWRHRGVMSYREMSCLSAANGLRAARREQRLEKATNSLAD